MRLDARIPVELLPRERGKEAGPAPARAQAARTLLVGVDPATADLAGAGWMAVIEVQPDDLEAGAPGHAANCACCMPYAPLARLLSALFQRRARGTLGLFNRVCLLLPREAVLPAAGLIGENPLLSGCYRVEKDRGEN